ncbi:MAG: hypothetical protein U0V72_04430 [Cytophagales bacterium]
MNIVLLLLLNFVTNLETLISAMHEKYHNNYNKNITFIQKNIEYKSNGDKTVSVLYEAHNYPDHMRVDYGFTPNINGVIYTKDSIYNFSNGKHINTSYGKNPMVFLTGDIYYLHKEKILKTLVELGFNTTKFKTVNYEGKKTYVVGTETENDTLSEQFWIDAENLYLVRLIKKNSATQVLEDMHFIEHEKVGDSWVEDRVIVYSNGIKIREELYTEVNPNNELDPTIFNPKFWGKVHWHKKTTK